MATACVCLLTTCSQKSNKTVIDNEPTSITWIEDKPGGSMQPLYLYPDVPDSLWNALGLLEGIPSSMSCFLLKTEGKNILLDAGLGAPFSQLFPKLKELGVAHEELQHKDRLHLFEAGDTLEGGVKTIAAYGHTPGHTVFQKDSILVIADLIHGAALQLDHPEYCPSYDMDADAARQSRLKILEYAHANNLTMYGMHLPAPGSTK